MYLFKILWIFTGSVSLLANECIHTIHLRSDTTFLNIYYDTVKHCEENNVVIPKVIKRKISTRIDYVLNNQYFADTKKEKSYAFEVNYKNLNEEVQILRNIPGVPLVRSYSCERAFLKLSMQMTNNFNYLTMLKGIKGQQQLVSWDIQNENIPGFAMQHHLR
ncbi:zinc finger MYM-type protein 1-like [Aphis craccivora]|uniref:Zinc finger MYM-type protein 1-like n=1 Tax=Aphis craccivora TaxID=307492 RepID=A0A6G0YGE3_APHCR|nr:zinc finger MYM-type protein 1-like [Aphis craccivora]